MCMMINANGLSILQLIQSLMAGVGAQGTGTIQINGMPFPTGSTGTEGVYSDMVLDKKMDYRYETIGDLLALGDFLALRKSLFGDFKGILKHPIWDHEIWRDYFLSLLYTCIPYFALSSVA